MCTIIRQAFVADAVKAFGSVFLRFDFCRTAYVINIANILITAAKLMKDYLNA